MPTQYRERPVRRRAIISQGSRPHLDANRRFDGFAVDANGDIKALSAGMRTQMRLMLEEGFFDDGVAPVPEPNTTARYYRADGSDLQPRPTHITVARRRGRS